MPAEAKSERTPIFRNVHISGMTVTDVKTPIKIVGLEEAPILTLYCVTSIFGSQTEVYL